MWPYTDEEWETITYGVKKKVKSNKVLIASAIPSIVLIILLLSLI